MNQIIIPDEVDMDDILPLIACGRCRFYVTTTGNAGVCRYNPPTPYIVGTDKLGRPVTAGFWPPVGHRDWCGRFELPTEHTPS